MVTDHQIRMLAAEAAEACDWAMYEMCQAAIAGSVEARNLCADAIKRAKAQEDK